MTSSSLLTLSLSQYENQKASMIALEESLFSCRCAVDTAENQAKNLIT